MQLDYELHQLTQEDLGLMDALLITFGEVFNEMDTYVGNRPRADYMRRLLGSDYFIALVAVRDGVVIGASLLTS